MDSSVDTFIEQETPPATTVQEFDSLIESLGNLREQIENARKAKQAIEEEADRLETKLMLSLEEMGRSNYKSPRGTISVTNKWRVTLPQTEEDKAALFAHLKERQIDMQYLTVNSNSLNSLFMQDWEAAKERGDGMEFRMPGIGEPKLNKILSFRKA